MISRKVIESFNLVIGLFLVVTGFLVKFYWDEILDSVISKQYILSESVGYYDYWIKNPVSAYDSFYLLNWTNPNGMREPGYKPVFKEMGPYVYKEVAERVNVTWNDNGTVSYAKVKRWIFQPDLSVGSLKDNVTTINGVAVAAAYASRYWTSLGRFSVNMALKATEELHLTGTIKEFLFDGVYHPLLSAGSVVPGLSALIPFSRYAFFYEMNDTSSLDGNFNVDTGVKDMSTFGQVRMWNYRNHTGMYPGSCGDVKGADNELWSPKRNKEDEIYLFCPELCRYLRFKFTREEYVHGILGYRYDVVNAFDNGTSDPRNKCFSEYNQFYSGVQNVSLCKYGAPLFASFPYFSQGDEWYRSKIEGMKSNSGENDSFIILEPTYGVPLKAGAKLQANVLVQPYSDIGLFDGVPRIFFPVMWATKDIIIPRFMAYLLWIILALPTIGIIISVIMIGTGTAFTLFYFVRRRYNVQILPFRIEPIQKRKKEDGQIHANCEAASPLMTAMILSNNVKVVKDYDK